MEVERLTITFEKLESREDEQLIDLADLRALNPKSTVRQNIYSAFHKHYGVSTCARPSSWSFDLSVTKTKITVCMELPI